MVIQDSRDSVDDVVRNRGIYLTGELDESRRKIELFRFPRKIERIDRNAVPAKTGSRIKRSVTERLCGGGVDHLPNVDSHAVGQKFQLVNERDIYAAVYVFEQLHQLCGASRRNGYDSVNHFTIQSLSCF